MKKITEFNGIELNSRIDKTKVIEFEQGYEFIENFTHEEDGLKFDYTYFLEVIDLSWYEVDSENTYLFNLYMTVKENSLHPKIIDSILQGENFDIISTDLIDYGYGSVLMSGDKYTIEENEIEDLSLKIMSLVPLIDGMRGFFLDKPINMLGTTGWDMLNHAVNNVDWI